jgi:Cytochrome c, mono- and diheme variants
MSSRCSKAFLATVVVTGSVVAAGASSAPMVSMGQGAVGPLPGPMRGSEPSTPNPYQHEPNALAEGRHMFVVFNCSGCHGDHAGGGMGPSLRDATWIYGNKSTDIFNSIASGRANGMPAWGAMLPPKQIWEIVAYIQSLRTPQEPQPPQ